MKLWSNATLITSPFLFWPRLGSGNILKVYHILCKTAILLQTRSFIKAQTINNVTLKTSKWYLWFCLLIFKIDFYRSSCPIILFGSRGLPRIWLRLHCSQLCERSHFTYLGPWSRAKTYLYKKACGWTIFCSFSAIWSIWKAGLLASGQLS